MQRRYVFALLFAVLEAACVSRPQVPETVNVPEPADVRSLGWEPLLGGSSLSGMDLVFDAPTACTVVQRIDARGPAGRLFAFGSLTDSAGRGGYYAAGYDDRNAPLHAAGIVPLGSGMARQGGRLEWGFERMEGTWSFVIAFRDAEPDPPSTSPPWPTPAGGYGLDIACDRPFHAAALHRTSNFQILDDETDRSVAVEGSAPPLIPRLEGTVQYTTKLTGKDGIGLSFVHWGAEFNTGTLRLTGPAVDERWTLESPTVTISKRLGPGTYDVGIDRVRVDASSFHGDYGVLFGMERRPALADALPGRLEVVA